MKNDLLNYEFDNLGNSPEDGFNDPLKTIFGQMSETVAREAFQNSIDAALDTERPVVIKITLKNLRQSEIPKSESIKKIFSSCSKSKNAKKHFENALRVLESNSIPTLIISDFNTTGLTGENNDKSGKFYNFFKSVGGHNKPAGSAGSYGYGKATNIAFSEIDTFFATSNHGGDKEDKILFMGCIRVCSHIGSDGFEKRGVGSFGLKNQQPVRDCKMIPPQFLLEHRKRNRGTDIFIPGYKDHEGWEVSTIKSALKNFWLAILNGKIEVEVGEVIINRESIHDIIRIYFPKENRTGNSWRREDPVPYFEAYTMGKCFSQSLPSMGKVEAWIRGGDHENATNYVACFRKNLMLIQYRMFKSIVPFSGVFICLEEPGNTTLQKMEPPQHDKWDLQSLHAQGENGRPLPECIQADREYREFLRDKIKGLLDTHLSKRIELSSVDKFISIAASNGQLREGSATYQSDNLDIPAALGPVKREVVKLRPKRQDSAPTDFDKGAPGGDSTDLGPGDETHTGRGGPGLGHPAPPSRPPGSVDVGPDPGATTAKISKSTTRAFPVVDESGRLVTKVIIRTTPPKPNKVFSVSFQAGTDDGSFDLPVASVQAPATIDGSRNVAGAVSDSEGVLRLEVTFVRNQRYALKAKLHEHI